MRTAPNAPLNGLKLRDGYTIELFLKLPDPFVGNHAWMGTRNPTQPSRGITTLGKPFVLGGTQFAGNYGQGFYGWLGDVRIVARTLKPVDFLPRG